MQLLSGGGPIPTDIAALNNRNSNESGFESMYSLRISRDHQTSSSTSYKSSNTYSSSSTTNSQLHKSESILDAMGSLGGGGKLISMITTGQHLQQQQQQHQKIDTFVTQASGESGDIVLTTATTEVCSSRVQKASLSKVIQYGSIEANDEVFSGIELNDKPPALPVKTRSHSIRRERHPSQYDNVDDAELERG